MKFNLKSILGVVAIGMAAQSVSAADFFVGLSRVDSQFDQLEWPKELHSTLDDQSIDDQGSRVFGGIQFSKYLAVRIDYTNYGEFREYINLDALRSVSGKADVKGLSMALEGKWNFHEHFGLHARAGFSALHAVMKSEYCAATSQVGSVCIASGEKKYSSHDPITAFGVHAQYNDVTIALDSESISSDFGKLEATTISLSYQF